MDLNYLKKVIKIFDDSGLSEIKLEEEGLKIKLSKYSDSSKTPSQQVTHVVAQPAANTENVTPVEKIPPSMADVKKDEEAMVGHVIKSPIVGTFYSSPSPDSEPFVEVGQHVSKGAPLCIIEAMKLMNEIESDISGTVTKILIENAQPVEYGQPIFVIKAD